MKRRGFSLLEVLLSIPLMMLVAGTMFFLFGVCSTNFQVGMTRQSLQAELRRISTRLGTEIRQSSFYTVKPAAASFNVDMEPGLFPMRRDCLSFAHPNNFDPVTGMTVWDGYLVYTATGELPLGRLVTYRVATAPPPDPTEQKTLGNFMSNLVLYTTVPSSQAEPGSTKTLTRDLLSFQADRDEANQLVVIHVAVRGSRGHTAEGRRSTAESAEIVVRYRAENTWPRM